MDAESRMRQETDRRYKRRANGGEAASVSGNAAEVRDQEVAAGATRRTKAPAPGSAAESMDSKLAGGRAGAKWKP
jgi:hypothetical protein